MSRIKYIPLAVSVLTLIIFWFGFFPLAAFIASLGLFSQGFSLVVAAFLILIPTFFIIGLNANRKVFSGILVLMGIVLIIGFFLL